MAPLKASDYTRMVKSLRDPNKTITICPVCGSIQRLGATCGICGVVVTRDLQERMKETVEQRRARVQQELEWLRSLNEE